MILHISKIIYVKSDRVFWPLATNVDSVILPNRLIDIPYNLNKHM